MAVSCISVAATYEALAGGAWDVSQSGGTIELSQSYVVIYEELESDALDRVAASHERIQDARIASDGADSIPVKGSRLPEAAGTPGSTYYYCLLTDIAVHNTANSYVFIVECRYTNASDGYNPDGTQYPWDYPWDIDFPNKVERRIETVTRITTDDVAANPPAIPYGKFGRDFGEPIATTAGEVYFPPPEENFYPTVIRLEKSYEDDTAWKSLLPSLMELRGKLNDRDWITGTNGTIAGVQVPKHYGRVTGVDVTSSYFDGKGTSARYWTAVFTIQVNDEPWYRELWNKGTYAKDANDKILYDKDANNRKVTGAVRYLATDGESFTDVKTSNLFGTILDLDWTVAGFPEDIDG